MKNLILWAWGVMALWATLGFGIGVRTPPSFLLSSFSGSCALHLSPDLPVELADREIIWGVFSEDRAEVFALWNLLTLLERSGKFQLAVDDVQGDFNVLSLMSGRGIEGSTLASFFSSGKLLKSGRDVKVFSIESDFEQHFRGSAYKNFLLDTRGKIDSDNVRLLDFVHFVHADPALATAYDGLPQKFHFLLIRSMRFLGGPGQAQVDWQSLFNNALNRLHPRGSILLTYSTEQEEGLIRAALTEAGAEIVDQGAHVFAPEIPKQFFMLARPAPGGR